MRKAPRLYSRRLGPRVAFRVSDRIIVKAPFIAQMQAQLLVYLFISIRESQGPLRVVRAHACSLFQSLSGAAFVRGMLNLG